ncbi:diguanylate cyclase [Pontibacillus sp. ALD_SL1]|uniref:GGDEF domain-containing response regulator n=1 Tax=Pontibacillus sp. ALD_SL1 TaxID=2777185 RepID=UPI001A96A4F0|nr:diguanylate cyclase [Pontibacillus sp. ALD_SL1]QSS99587.1 diguanylate cyclase [Pontibacillus sp. ALD_SL1]
MQKYQTLFLKRTRSTLQSWGEHRSITNGAMYQFLHSLKGTASSIGLPSITEVATNLMQQLPASVDYEWKQERWQSFLSPLTEELQKHSTVEVLAEPLIEKIKDETPRGSLVLLVGDQIDRISNLKDMLEEHYAVMVAANESKAVEVFYSQKPDYVIIDLHQKEDHGFHVLSSIANKARHSFVPTLLVEDAPHTMLRKKAYEAGAFDIVHSPFDNEEMLALIQNRLELKRVLQAQILLDELTGAYNRKFLQEELQRQWAEFERYETTFSVAMLDLDRFKRINDTYGHDTGDLVLKQFAETIMKNKRQGDYFIRYGGEEFMLIMPKTNREQARMIVDRLLQVFSEQPFEKDGTTFTCSFSSGVASVHHRIKHTDEIISHGDQALYMAKRNGRNQVQVYDEQKRDLAQNLDVIRIGIIDDDPIIHELLQDHLRKLTFKGHKVELRTFREGEEFFESKWYQQDGKFVLLLDGVMPRMDGLEVLRKLREECSVDQFVIIMLTGRKKDQDIVKALDLGADDYITKPFSVSELEARVKRLAQRLLF